MRNWARFSFFFSPEKRKKNEILFFSKRSEKHEKHVLGTYSVILGVFSVVSSQTLILYHRPFKSARKSAIFYSR